MARVKTARITRKKHKKVLKQAKGYFGAKSYRFRNANQAVLKSFIYPYGNNFLIPFSQVLSAYAF